MSTKIKDDRDTYVGSHKDWTLSSWTSAREMIDVGRLPDGGLSSAVQSISCLITLVAKLCLLPPHPETSSSMHLHQQV